MPVTRYCTLCGEPSPPIPDEELAGLPPDIPFQHAVCPGTAPEPEPRSFKVTVEIVEVTRDPATPDDVPAEIRKVLGGFTVHAFAETPLHAMPALTDSMSEKWAEAAEKIAYADRPVKLDLLRGTG